MKSYSHASEKLRNGYHFSAKWVAVSTAAMITRRLNAGSIPELNIVVASELNTVVISELDTAVSELDTVTSELDTAVASSWTL